MQIANPIYDVVFKYLMEDSKVAKLIISAIIDEEIESLEFKPQEYVTEVEPDKKERKPDLSYPGTLTVYRLDFSAKIKTNDGFKNILIEIQKAKFPTDIMRFRKYLGDNYSNNDNTYESDNDKKAIPILSIYFLGHKLDHLKSPVIKVKRHYYDGITGTELKDNEEFIESLTHDSVIIQIPYLKEPRRTELEQLLSIFDQGESHSTHHILNVKEEDFPEKYGEIIRRLQRAIAEKKIRQTMDIEDEIIEELKRKQRQIEKFTDIIEEKDKTIDEKDKTIVEKNKTIEDKDKELIKKELELDDLKKKLIVFENLLKNK
jgi:hypothetical protein